MAKSKTLGLDADGIQKMMRKGDYMADMGGQLALGIMGNLVGQLTYFYTDKVGLAVGGVGVAMMIAKILDAFTDIIFGHFIDRMKGGKEKYYKWLIYMGVPAAVITILLFTVPGAAGDLPALIYVCITNILFTAVIYTMISTPYAAIMVIRTNSQSERNSIGVFRAVGNYGAGMIISIATIPLTNVLGGTQSAWIKYGVIIGLAILLLFLVSWNNLRKAKFADEAGTGNQSEAAEEETGSFADSLGMLVHNKYWIIVLLFNLITQITNSLTGSAGTYYCKWIFGNDNLVAILGSGGMIATVIGFILSKPIINKVGVRNTIYFGLIGAALMAGIRCFAPSNFVLYMVTGLIGSFVQIPLMCLYGVLLAMAVDYNEWKYGKRLLAISSGAIGFGSKVGGGIGTLLLTGILTLGGYEATLAVATDSMRMSIYALGNYVPLIINLLMFAIFTQFDLEKKLPQIHADLEERRKEKAQN
ncbi:MAG: MFS transporter [Eubacterium sp.]|nr:MFS transporter [Eubacterium sp.]MCM1216075.1 MFS transporter [Lachnospiraceae bacterium]MCM1239816.1 MFS transporter [Lachnospiraceae bacterium]MCM1343710.1 MFS transporter [Muribaculaceae bacterium]MCM1410190.1 MFS transporter [Lachnospiraceae bacterium]